MAKLTRDKAKMQTNRFSVWVSGMLAVNGYSLSDLANYLNIDPAGLWRRIHGETRWTLEEFYRVQEFFKEDYKL